MGGRGRSCQGRQVGRSHSTLMGCCAGSKLENPSEAAGKFRTRCYLRHFNDCNSVSLLRRSRDDARTFCALHAPKAEGVNYFTHVSGFLLLNNSNEP